jgi:betaine-aldehyde dehydrogenase
VHGKIHDAFVEAVLARAAKIRIGLPELEETQMGPVVSRRQYDRVMRYIETGKREGAVLVRGGGNVPAHGFFIDVTVFDQVRHGMTVEREEIFGPVMSILTWDDEAEMLREVNDTDYGLCANIWTNDIATALRMADAVEAGYVWINGHGAKRHKGAPFGGFKDSGVGREHSLGELMSFTQLKNVNVSY